MVTYTSAILAAANLLALAHAAPAQPVCKVVTETITGAPFWVPTPKATSDPGWGTWADPKDTSKTTWSTWADPKETSKSTWGTWADPDSASKTTWSSWADPKKTSTSSLFWGEWPSGVPKPTSDVGHDHTDHTYPTASSTTTTTFSYGFPPTTTAPPATTTTTTPSAPTTTTTTTSAAPSTSTCPASGNPTLNQAPAGSCGCTFTTHCNMKANPGSDAVFWQRSAGEQIDTLEECMEICNNNDQCQAIVWSNQDGEPASDYKMCYQVINLPQPATTGYGQLTYKGSCSGTCSQSYNTTPS